MEVEGKLEARLADLPDVYPGFVRSAMLTIGHRGLVDDVLVLLDEVPDATTEDVIAYEWLRCGMVDRFDDDGARVPVPCEWLALTSGMRGILAEMKGKTLNSYQLTPIGADGMLTDRSVRINLGQHAVDLNCFDFTFEVIGQPVELGAMLSERMSLRDDFRPWSDEPYRAYAVGERITGVELVTDHAEVLHGRDADALDVDAAVVVRTAHATYTFARESWASTGIRITVSDGVAVPYGPDEISAAWLGLPEGCGVTVGEASRTVERLA